MDERPEGAPEETEAEIDLAEAIALEGPMTAEALADRIREQALGTADTVVDRTGIPERREDEEPAGAT